MAKAPGPRCHVVATLLAVGAALIASPVSPARAVAKPSPSTTRIASGPETRLLVAATRAAALREANRFRVTIGHPVCPAGTRTPMPVVQCLVVLGDTTVAYLVGMAPDGTLAAHPTFPVVSSSCR